MFRFEKWWLHKESFAKVVEKVWAQPCQATNSLDVWQVWIRTLRRFARGWAANEVASINKENVVLALEYNDLEKGMESRILSDQDFLDLNK